MVWGVSNARISVCSPGSAATQRLPPGPRRVSKTCSMGCAGSSEVTCTVAVAVISISPGSGTGWLGGAFTMCFRSMTPPWLLCLARHRARQRERTWRAGCALLPPRPLLCLWRPTRIPGRDGGVCGRSGVLHPFHGPLHFVLYLLRYPRHFVLYLLCGTLRCFLHLPHRLIPLPLALEVVVIRER